MLRSRHRHAFRAGMLSAVMLLCSPVSRADSALALFFGFSCYGLSVLFSDLLDEDAERRRWREVERYRRAQERAREAYERGSRGR